MLHTLISGTESLLIARLPLSLLYHLPGYQLLCMYYFLFRSTHNDFPQQEHGGRTDVGTRADEGRELHKLPLLEHDGSHFQCYTHSCGKYENPSYFWII
jgi:hypothetical protein